MLSIPNELIPVCTNCKNYGSGWVTWVMVIIMTDKSGKEGGSYWINNWWAVLTADVKL